MWTIVKVFMNLLQSCFFFFFFTFWFFSLKACGILGPWQGIVPSELKGEALTTNHQGSPKFTGLNDN